MTLAVQAASVTVAGIFARFVAGDPVPPTYG